VVEGVELTETVTDAGLLGAAVLVGAMVPSDVREPVRE
jgi:hypothetical protein